jgi:hypothetical protein
LAPMVRHLFSYTQGEEKKVTVRRTDTIIDIYAYAEPRWSTMDLAGFSVEATDGGIGKVDEASHEIGSGHLVVDTGPWIFGKKVMIPAAAITRVDEGDRQVWVSLSKDEIQHAPEFDESTYRTPGYRDELGTYYRDRIGLNRPAGPDYGKDDRGF